MIAMSSLKGGQLPAGARLLRVSKGGQIINYQIPKSQAGEVFSSGHVQVRVATPPIQASALTTHASTPMAQVAAATEVSETVVTDPSDFVNSVTTSVTSVAEEQVVSSGSVQYKDSDGLMDALPTDEEIAKTIVAGGGDMIEETMDVDNMM